jgi:hypothetical protein
VLNTLISPISIFNAELCMQGRSFMADPGFLLDSCFTLCLLLQSRDNSVGIELGYGLDDRGSRVRFPARAGNFSLHYRF